VALNILGRLSVTLGLQDESFVQGMRRSRAGLKQFERDHNRMATNMRRSAMNFIAAYTTISGGRALLRLSDQFTEMQNKLRVTATSGLELNAVFQQLKQISYETQQPLEELTAAYARFRITTQALGKSSQETLDFTRSVAQTFRISGSSAKEAAAATIQLAQAMGKGKLDGDELRSVLENNTFLAKELGKEYGVAAGQLIELGAKGILNSESLFAFMLKNLDEFNEKALKINPTFEKTGIVLRDAFSTGFMEKFNGTLGAIAASAYKNRDAFYALGGALADYAKTWVRAFRIITSGLSASFDGTRTLSAGFETLKGFILLAAHAVETLATAINAVAVDSVSFFEKFKIWRGEQAKDILEQGKAYGRTKEQMQRWLAEGERSKVVMDDLSKSGDLNAASYDRIKESMIRAGQTTDEVFGKISGRVGSNTKLLAQFNSEAEAMQKAVLGVKGESIVGAKGLSDSELKDLKKKADEEEKRRLSFVNGMLDIQYEKLDRVKRMADSVGDSFADAFGQAITGADSFRQSLGQVLQMLAQLVYKETIGNQLAGGISSIFGNAFGNFLGGDTPSYNSSTGFYEDKSGASQTIMPFAKGGVVQNATMFPMKGGTGLMGEAGPEAIMPLTKDGQGRLGVRAQGGGSQVVYNIDARGADAGVEERLMNALKQLDSSIEGRAVSSVQNARFRNPRLFGAAA
jgi:lambda family phage tail tape measure protein